LTQTGVGLRRFSEGKHLWSNFYWSEELYRIFGFDPGPTPPSSRDSRAAAPGGRALEQTLVEQAFETESTFEVDYRLVLPNGAAKYIHVSEPV